MVAANKIIRKGGDSMISDLKALGLSDKTITERTTPDYLNRTGFYSYELQSNNADIKRLRTRVGLLEAKVGSAESGNKSEVIEGIELVQNYDIDRVQLKYGAKPGPAVIEQLHRRGFHFSRTEEAWQRKLTADGITAARDVAKIGKGR